MSFCKQRNEPVDDNQCMSCFMANYRTKYRLRMECVAQHIIPVPESSDDFEGALSQEVSPAQMLIKAAWEARQFIYHRGGHTTEARTLIRALDEALAAMRETEAAHV